MKNLSKRLWRSNSQLKMSHVLNFYSVNKKTWQEIRPIRVLLTQWKNPITTYSPIISWCLSTRNIIRHSPITQLWWHSISLEKMTSLLLQMMMLLSTSVTHSPTTNAAKTNPGFLTTRPAAPGLYGKMLDIFISTTVSAQRAEPGVLHHWHQAPASTSPSPHPPTWSAAPRAAHPAPGTGHPPVFPAHALLLHTHLGRLLLPNVQKLLIQISLDNSQITPGVRWGTPLTPL